eukprot:10088872-Prorocentrum_lima.AAC.1
MVTALAYESRSRLGRHGIELLSSCLRPSCEHGSPASGTGAPTRLHPAKVRHELEAALVRAA